MEFFLCRSAAATEGAGESDLVILADSQGERMRRACTREKEYNMRLMATINGRILEDLLPSQPQPRVFRLSQSVGLMPQTTLWGSAHEAPATLGNCHEGIARALAGEKNNEFSWWSTMLERHLSQLVTGYMDGCRKAHQWNLKEIAQVHWYSFSVKMRLRAAKHFPSLWRGAGHSLAALNVIHSS